MPGQIRDRGACDAQHADGAGDVAGAGLRGRNLPVVPVAEAGRQQGHLDEVSCQTDGVLMPGKLILFPEYAPDVTPLGQAESQTIFNVVARGDGYGPVQSLQGYSLALPDLCRGYFFGRKSDGSVAIFAGTSTDLYVMNPTSLGLTRVSKAGVSY